MSETQDQQQTVYRTLQDGKRLQERHVGPLFTTQQEAKRAMEHFIENEHNAETTEWVEASDTMVKMIPDDSRSVFMVCEVTIRESLEELLDARDVDDGEEVTAVAD